MNERTDADIGGLINRCLSGEAQPSLEAARKTRERLVREVLVRRRTAVFPDRMLGVMGICFVLAVAWLVLQLVVTGAALRSQSVLIVGSVCAFANLVGLPPSVAMIVRERRRHGSA